MARLAYADPPYPGQARSRYGGTEVNHRILIGTLMDQADRWALSTSSTALVDLLPMVPRPHRIAVWAKTYSATGYCVPRFSWEPVILYGCFQPTVGTLWYQRGAPMDWLICPPAHIGMASRSEQKFVPGGAKPPDFCEWLFGALFAATPEDTFWDVFPGSGAVTRAWHRYINQPIAGSEDLPLFAAANR